MLIVIAYALAMRGARPLRGWLLLHFIALLPYAAALTLWRPAGLRTAWAYARDLR